MGTASHRRPLRPQAARGLCRGAGSTRQTTVFDVLPRVGYGPPAMPTAFSTSRGQPGEERWQDPLAQGTEVAPAWGGKTGRGSG